jgi:glycosyltransferase involved in cell wall biosynthesis
LILTLKVSVIICTRNRADRLAQTLDCLKAIEVPPGFQPEILVVDNGSTDHTAEVVRCHPVAKIPVRYLFEPLPGVSRAKNAGLADCRGEVMLCIDDDVEPQGKWMEHMAAPLVRRECDAVVGRIELAKELCRPWMTPQHKSCLAVSDQTDTRPDLIGASMGFRRSVLDQIPGFDVELGPGASGFWEETLFSWQMIQAGFRIQYVPDALAIHHPDPSRLLRSSWLATGRKNGASSAYIDHHWRHKKFPFPRVRYCYYGIKLWLRRLLDPPVALDAEGIAIWELSYVGRMEKYRRFLIERRRPRNYSQYGLRKRGS